ncbi:8349_t:CDS:2 [Funneliformis geosporum]|uniref:3490_t:CDS:1 n=1 Tax=Funneliformis geosporum TaxID=1117311 RepID=A0A9W4SBX3_9GLOM|nr:3490_t:CDS:2 [Funneliformis geosporum]CAI2183805.1 8349_t:CDS:2 [Funneliformis geosporum]
MTKRTNTTRVSPEERIILNINGVKYETYRSTLIAYPDTLLGTMFQERNRNLQNPNKDGEYFFDRNGKAFHYVMEFYRTGQILWDTKTVLGIENGTNITKKELEEELDYFQIKPKDVRLDSALTSASSIVDKFIQALESMILKHVSQLGKTIFINATQESVIVNRVRYEPEIDPIVLRKFNFTAYRLLKEVGNEIAQYLYSSFPDLNIVWKSERSDTDPKCILVQLTFNYSLKMIFENSQVGRKRPRIN